MNKELEIALDEAEKKAWSSLSKYKFQMFGYWASIWVHLNKIGEFHRNNPFSPLVSLAAVTKKEKHYDHREATSRV